MPISVITCGWRGSCLPIPCLHTAPMLPSFLSFSEGRCVTPAVMMCNVGFFRCLPIFQNVASPVGSVPCAHFSIGRFWREYGKTTPAMPWIIPSWDATSLMCSLLRRLRQSSTALIPELGRAFVIKPSWRYCMAVACGFQKPAA